VERIYHYLTSTDTIHDILYIYFNYLIHDVIPYLRTCHLSVLFSTYYFMYFCITTFFKCVCCLIITLLLMTHIESTAIYAFYFYFFLVQWSVCYVVCTNGDPLSKHLSTNLDLQYFTAVWHRRHTPCYMKSLNGKSMVFTADHLGVNPLTREIFKNSDY
jgi:hypothetical protein